MDGKTFRTEFAELLKRYKLFPQQPGRLTVVCNTTPEEKIGSVKISPEYEVR